MTEGKGNCNPGEKLTRIERWQNEMYFKIAIIVATDLELRQDYERTPEKLKFQTHQLCLIPGVRSKRYGKWQIGEQANSEITDTHDALVRDLLKKIESNTLEACRFTGS